MFEVGEMVVHKNSKLNAAKVLSKGVRANGKVILTVEVNKRTLYVWYEQDCAPYNPHQELCTLEARTAI